MLERFPSSTYLHSQLALVSYSEKDYSSAKEHFEKMRAEDPFKVETLDTYSNVLYVAEEKGELGRLAREIELSAKYTPESCCVVGNYYSLKGEHEKAVR